MGLISKLLPTNSLIHKIYRLVKRVVITLFVAHLVYVLLLIFMPVFTTPTIIGQWVGGKTIYKQWVSSDKISESAKRAVIASEDQEFGEHFGFDVEEIEKAMKYNETHKRKKGASTISQQVAKNVFLWQGRTWFRKGIEVYCTLVIELFWSKDRILEVYLNVAEMGDGVFGIEAAAKTFFGKSASKLTNEEAALIAACLPNPIKFKVNAPSDYVRKRQRWILWQMRNIDWSKD
jgi:monofunctional biosynthetic peptidoglycan transglycosylase